jgi:uncharacterized membrane-anchored protein
MTPSPATSLRSLLLAVAALQTLAVGWMVFDRVSLLSSGREITAAVVPVDPRDIFRGDFVILGYAFNSATDVALPPGSRQGDTVYALLKNAGPAEWTLAALSATKPEAAGEGEVVLRAIVDHVPPRGATGGPLMGRLRYGIERFYVPEGTGRALEAQVREKRIEAVLAVGADGKTAIKGLKVDGALVAEEPLL